MTTQNREFQRWLDETVKITAEAVVAMLGRAPTPDERARLSHSIARAACDKYAELICERLDLLETLVPQPQPETCK